MKHKWLGNICTVCGIQRKKFKSDGRYITNYFDKNNNIIVNRPLCKIK